MKKLLLALLCAAATLVTACSKNESLSGDKIYFFYQTSCPHCHDAAKYIKEQHPDLKITALDVKLPGNMRLFQQALEKYGVAGNAGTPFITFGDKYIMGWSDSDKTLFDVYSKPYAE